jgi:protein TonB
MSTAAVIPETGPDELTAWRGGSSEPRRDRAFPMWVGIAAACHLLFVIGLYTAPPRVLGDPGGSADGVSVEIVTEAQAMGRAAVAEEAAGIAVAASPPVETPPPAPPAQQAETQPPMPAEPPPAAEAPQAPPAPVEQAAAEAAKPALPPPLEGLGAPLLLQPEPSKKAEEKPQEKAPAKAAQPPPQETKEVRPQEKPKQQRREQPQHAPQKTAKLDLSMPPSMMMAPPGAGGAGVSRPPGHTRSGENDTFFRGVVRALQIAMPQLRDTVGIVTIRIFLDMNGNLVRTEVLSPSGVPGLDQSVVFSTKQASFPFPPRNATPADLEFRIRYLYNIRDGG